MLRPPPPRKQPAVLSRREENRNTVSDEGSQGSRRKTNCEQCPRTKRLHCGLGASFTRTGFLFPQDGRVSCCSAAPRLSRELRAPTPGPPRLWSFPAFRAKRQPHRRAAALWEEQMKPHTVLLHLWCSPWFHFFFFF